MTNVDRVMKWRHETKKRLISAFGGKCAICSYSRCDRALEFHHLDPNEKETHWGEISGQIRSWSYIVTELCKCVMLCSNCHKEVHAGFSEVPIDAPRILEGYDYRPAPFCEVDPCGKCGRIKNANWTYCLKCQSLRKVDWSLNDVVQLVEQHGTYQAVGRMLGISGAAVKRRYNQVQNKVGLAESA